MVEKSSLLRSFSPLAHFLLISLARTLPLTDEGETRLPHLALANGIAPGDFASLLWDPLNKSGVAIALDWTTSGVCHSGITIISSSENMQQIAL